LNEKEYEMSGNAFEFDDIAQNIFFPIYGAIALDIVATTGKRAGRVLDLGCGGGHLGLSLLKATGMSAVLLDKNPDAVGIAQRRATQWGLGERALAVRGDAMDIPLADASIDLAVSRGSVGFWADEEKAFSEILRVLSPGGMSWIGGGMGNGELKRQITVKMKARNPEWPDCLKKITNGYGAAEYRVLLEGLPLKAGGCPPFSFRVIDEPDRGMWIVIEREPGEVRSR
jgi:ubiquinone/menaquinone biosynthesis C-methylase UbiE